MFVFAFVSVVASLSGLLRGRGCSKRGPRPAHVNRAWNQTDHFNACGIIFRLIVMFAGYQFFIMFALHLLWCCFNVLFICIGVCLLCFCFALLLCLFLLLLLLLLLSLDCYDVEAARSAARDRVT